MEEDISCKMLENGLNSTVMDLWTMELLALNLGVIKFSGCDFGGATTLTHIGRKFKKDFLVA